MSWQLSGCTVYELNTEGVNDFSFHVQRKDHDIQKAEVVAALASKAPEMLQILAKLAEQGAYNHTDWTTFQKINHILCEFEEFINLPI